MGIFDFLKKNKPEENIEQELIRAVEEGREKELEQGENSDCDSTQDSLAQYTAVEEAEQVVAAPTEVEAEAEADKALPDSNTQDSPQTEASEENAAPEPVDNDEDLEPKQKEGFFAKIKSGLAKTRNNLMSGVENVLKSFTTIDEELYEELEEALIMADIGVETSVEIIDRLRSRVKAEKVHDVEAVKGLIVQVISDMLKEDKSELSLASPSVILVIGVNGVGKTTTIGKLANNYKKQGKSVVLAAADTFRAAAIDQLEVWGQRNDVQVVKHQENSDPGAVVFDAIQSAKAKNTDILICDTAGRLHNKKNLMDELAKIFKIIAREYPQAQQEVFLVLDATTGQNALQQAKLFKEAADITGLVLTKLDGTAKGGIIIAIKNELKIPVRYVGVGEGIDDLQPFNEEDFARALFED